MVHWRGRTGGGGHCYRRVRRSNPRANSSATNVRAGGAAHIASRSDERRGADLRTCANYRSWPDDGRSADLRTFGWR